MASNSYILLTSILGTSVAAAIGVFLLRQHFSRQAKRELKKTIQSLVIPSRTEAYTGLGGRPAGYSAEQAAKELKSSTGGPKKEDLGTKLFRAGLFYQSDRTRFYKSVAISIGVACLVGTAAILTVESLSPLLKLVVFAIVVTAGYIFPFTRLDKLSREREDEISYHLPLTIEQVAVGVSSGLDIWPCVVNIMQITEARNTVTPIIELFRNADRLIRSGLSVEEALRAVGERSGIPNLKHAFTFLAQVAEHGGDITRNLQEMADVTMMQRSTEVEGKIHALPVKATGPLCLVFAGFFAVMLAGLFVQMLSAFPKS